MGIIKQFREAEARVSGQQIEGWDVMMADLDEEDPKGRGTGKRRKSRGLSMGEKAEGEEEEKVVEVKKRKVRRRGTVGSEIGTESVASTETGDGESVRGKRSRRGSGVGRGRGRGRGRKSTGGSMDVSGEIGIET
jgi:DNA excision repair protein ERCC-5